MNDLKALWKWAAGILASLVVLSLVYAGSTFSTLSVQMAVIQAEMCHLKESVQAATADRYTISQAQAAASARDHQVAAIEKRLDTLAARITQLWDRTQ